MSETIGVEGRGSFYDGVGAIRDVLQNHLLQVVALLAMEPPAGSDSQFLQDEKAKVMAAMRPVDPGEFVRGQYVGYRDEPGVQPDSSVETFAAGASRDRLVALGGCALVRPRRQGAGRGRHRGRDRVPLTAPSAVRRSRRAAPGAQPRPAPARASRTGSRSRSRPRHRALTSTARRSTSRSTSLLRSVSGRQRTSGCWVTRSPDRRGGSHARTSSNRPGAWSSRRSTSPARCIPTSEDRGDRARPNGSSATATTGTSPAAEPSPHPPRPLAWHRAEARTVRSGRGLPHRLRRSDRPSSPVR